MTVDVRRLSSPLDPVGPDEVERDRRDPTSIADVVQQERPVPASTAHVLLRLGPVAPDEAERWFG